MSILEFDGVKTSTSTPEKPNYTAEAFLDGLRSGYNPQAIFRQASSDWEEAYSGKNLAEEVQRIVNLPRKTDEDRVRLKQELAWIKSLRKPGTRLVDIWKLVDSGHLPPSQLTEFVDAIGNFKDMAIYQNQCLKAADNLIQKAEAFQELATDNPPSFQPASFDDFFVKYSWCISEVRKFFAMEDPTLHFYHKLRYRIRTLRHYFTVLNLATGDPLAKAATKYLGPVSVEMGKVQDGVVALKIKGKINIHADTTTVADSHREIISTFLALHDYQ